MSVKVNSQLSKSSSPPLEKGIAPQDRRLRLSILWVFVMFNYVYADVLGLFDLSKVGTGYAGGVHFTEGLLLEAAVLMEIPIAMVLLSWVLPYRVNRWTNIIVGALQTVVVLVSSFIQPISAGTTTPYYLFFGAIEVVCTSIIVWYAWTWKAAPRRIEETP